MMTAEVCRARLEHISAGVEANCESAESFRLRRGSERSKSPHRPCKSLDGFADRLCTGRLQCRSGASQEEEARAGAALLVLEAVVCSWKMHRKAERQGGDRHHRHGFE